MASGWGRWNHNIYYHRVVLEALGAGCCEALEVGCGEGMLSRELRRVAEHVTAIDRDAASIDLARRSDSSREIDWLVGDFLTHPFVPASFDAVVSVAAVHHMDARAALKRMRQLLRPAGTLVVVGLARSRSATDLAVDLAGVVANLVHKAHGPYWEHSAPTVWPPPATYGEMRGIAEEQLPGARYRRHLLFRYSLVWIKPAR